MKMILDPLITRNLYNPKTRKAELDKALQKVSNFPQLGGDELVQQWTIIGECYKQEKNPTLSEEAYIKALSIAQEISDAKLHGAVLKHLGDAMFFCNEYQKAHHYYRVALDIFEQLKNFPEVIEIYSQAAYTCEKLGDREKERTFLDTAVAIADIEPVIKGNFVERLALSLAASKRYKEGAANYEQALSLYELENFKRGWEERIKNLAQIYNLMGDKETEERTLQRSFKS